MEIQVCNVEKFLNFAELTLLNGCVHTILTRSHFCAATDLLSFSGPNILTLFLFVSFLLSTGVMKDDATRRTFHKMLRHNLYLDLISTSMCNRLKIQCVAQNKYQLFPPI